MNQRQKRARDRRREGQDIGASTMHTGGHVVAHRRGEDPVVRTPQKATGDVPGNKTQGIAKASPFFKKLNEVVSPKNKKEEAKVIANSVEKPVAPTQKQKQEDKKEENAD